MKKLALALITLSCCTELAFGGKLMSKPHFGNWGVDLSNLDTQVKPGDDFFLYANGNWLNKVKIPEDRSGTGSFLDLQILSEKRMKSLVAELLKRKPASLNPEEKQLRDLYTAFTDIRQIEQRGLEPIQGILKRIVDLKTPKDVAALMGDPGFPSRSLFASEIATDAKNPNVYVVIAGQSGLGLPDRDYYLRDEPNLAKTRKAYQDYLATMLKLLGEKEAKKRATAVYELETKIAKAHWPAAERRDADKTYNPTQIKKLPQLAPGFAWEAFFKAQGIAPQRKVILLEKSAFAPMAQVFANTPIAVWQDYLRIHALHMLSPYLPKAIDKADFNFYGKILAGKKQELPRETRGVKLLDAMLPHPFGKLYVAQYFPPTTKEKAQNLVDNLIKAYDANIRKITWMSPATRKKALEKLHAFKPHIGYPDEWRNYSGLRIDRNDLIGNVERAHRFEWAYRLNRIDQPVDRNEWFMTPSTVNAYYTPDFNAIVFPAAILQPPFFDPNADDAVNYGGIGSVIGHEISHGFDDQGSKYTGDGILKSWWTPKDRKTFEERTAALSTQFDAFEGLPGIYVNGKLTLGENIGDLSGVSIALKAYRLSLNGKDAPILNGFNGDQRFFLAYAQVWRTKLREEQLRQQLISNPHSPAQFRVVGPLRNIDEWYTAFEIKPKNKMYLAPGKRVKLW